MTKASPLCCRCDASERIAQILSPARDAFAKELHMKLQHYAPRAHRVAGANRSRERVGRRFLNGGLTLLELLIVLALIPLGAVFFLACMNRTRSDGAVRVRCASNLR